MKIKITNFKYGGILNFKMKNLGIIFDKIDKYLAILLIILSILATIFLLNQNIKLVPAPITILIFSALYLNRNNDLKDSFKTYISKKEAKVLFITIFIFINLSFISFIFRPELYSRPLTYFISISIASGLLAYVIILLPKNRNYEYLTLFIILIIGLSLRLTPQLLFPSLLGIDPWAHMEFTNSIISVGHIVGEGAYSKLPSMHLLIGSNSILTGLNYKWSSILSVSILQLVSFIIIYLTGKLLFNPKIGLMSALLLCISSNYISLGYWIHPTTFALIASAFLLFYLIKEEKKNSAANASIKILFGFLIVTTHMQVALAILIVLISFWIGKIIYNKIRDSNLEQFQFNNAKYIFIILFAVMMFSWWIYVTNRFELPLSLFHRAIEYDPSKIKDVTVTTLNLPYYQYLMNIMPYLFFYGFSIAGFLYSISKRSNAIYFALTLGGIALLATPFLMMESNMSGFLSERWIYSAQLFMAIPVAVGLMLFLNIKKGKIAYKRFLIIFLISIFAFVNVINPSANIDNSQLSHDSVIRYAHTESELQAVNTLQNLYNVSIYTDTINRLPISNNNSLAVDKPLEYKNYTELNGLIILRSILATSPVQGMELNYNPINELSVNNSFNRVYDSGSDVAFLNLQNPE